MRARRRKAARADAQRAAIVLLAAAGESNTAIAARVGVTRMTVTTCRNRFAKRRLPVLSDEPRPGAPRKIGDGKIADVVTATLESTPPGATHWSRRSMARASGLSVTTVHRIWSAFSLQPHRSETFELSTDPLIREPDGFDARCCKNSKSFDRRGRKSFDRRGRRSGRPPA